jgi:enterochelin esterase-like enzyme
MNSRFKLRYLSFTLTFMVLSCSADPVKMSADREGTSPLSETYHSYDSFPSVYISPRNVEVWLPPTYDHLEALPVLYMFDGQNIFHGFQGLDGTYNPGWQVDEVLDSLNRAGSVPEVIVVGIYCTPGMMRMSEYMPAKPYVEIRQRIAQTDHHWYKEFKSVPPRSNEQLKFIVKELKPFIDSRFKTKTERAGTFIAGSSMGGLISAYAICEYPEVFGGAACFSTHWPPLDGVFLEYLKQNLPEPATHKIYFDYGTEGLDAGYEPFQIIADSAMAARGYEASVNWLTMKFEGAAHNESDWHARFHIPMTFLLPEE